MFNLQQMFDKAIVDHTEKLKEQIVRKKFEKIGISLTAEQILDLFEQSEKGENVSLDLSAEQLKNASPDVIERGISIDFTDSEIQTITDEFSLGLTKAIPASVEDSAAVFLKSLDRRAKKEVRRLRKERRDFVKTVRQSWGNPLDLFELYLATCVETAGKFNEEYREAAAKEQNFVFDVLIRLHARACQIGFEVLTLLEAGLADGAHARWRTLHEIACVGLFIKEHEQEVAERYLLHDVVESYKGADQYQRWCKELKHRKIPKRTIDRLRRDYDVATNQFGRSFLSDYGWAAAVLSKERPRFSDIERDVGLEKFRPYYKLASQNVHAGSKGIVFKLGLPDGIPEVLAGPSNVGLADPAHGAAISLLQITTALVLSQPTIDTLTICSVLTKMERRIGEEFLNAHEEMFDDN